MHKRELRELRNRFRESVFKRDNAKCVVCGSPAVDAHHITDRSLMPNGGYTKENGISLCGVDHYRAETYHISGGLWWFKGYSPNDLYRMIESTYEAALRASHELQ